MLLQHLSVLIHHFPIQAKEAPQVGDKRKPNGDDDDKGDDDRNGEGAGRAMTAAERAEKEAAEALRQSATQAHARLR